MNLEKLKEKIKKLKVLAVAGSIHIYAFGIMFMVGMVVAFSFYLNNKRISTTYTIVDDSLISAVLSGCCVNMDEYTRSGQVVIYKTVTPLKSDSRYATYKVLEDDEIYSPGTDEYLNNSYNLFLDAITYDLKLDTDMASALSGINGEVEIARFSVFNKYSQYNASGDLEHFRFVEYKKASTGWLVEAHPLDTNVSVYNSLDKTNVILQDTAIVASLKFDAVLSNYVAWLFEGVSENRMKRKVSYQRVVELSDF